MKISNYLLATMSLSLSVNLSATHRNLLCNSTQPLDDSTLKISDINKSLGFLEIEIDTIKIKELTPNKSKIKMTKKLPKLSKKAKPACTIEEISTKPEQVSEPTLKKIDEQPEQYRYFCDSCGMG